MGCGSSKNEAITPDLPSNNQVNPYCDYDTETSVFKLAEKNDDD